ncbi:MAG: autotransporter-associated beta strand repeat-containing protein [Paludibacter sp.]|nr:autotransporter-associated beta strand repeat-containing protein [Paludibacter sp.]
MRKSLLILSAIALSICISYAQLVAFPGAEGFGKYAKGVRASSSPTVYHVTNLNDSGTGSFRDAVSSSNRVVVFDVAGVIKISSRIVISSNIYIAGQTAPGEGITIYGNGFSYSGANNVICRYLRMRMGAVGDSGKDACGVANGNNMIFDHVSVSWGRDETFSVSGSDISNITIQNSIIAQGLLSHSAGGLIQTDGGVTLYRNLYVDNDTRNNKIKGVNQYVNNMVYNWSSGAYLMGGDSEGQSYANCVSNYFINGPEKSVNALSGANSNYHIYADDNWWDKDRNGALNGYLVPESEYNGDPDFQSIPYNYPAVPTWPAESIIDSLLPSVGASLPYRDLLDCYVVNEVKSFGLRGEIITNETENSIGAPSSWTVWSGTKKTDTDNDGIPDDWETANGLNPSLASDAVTLASNGYLNIENYINSITDNDSQDFLRAPLCLVADSTTQNDIYLYWFDFTDKEDGYCIEKKVGGTYTEVGRTGVNENTFQVTGLNPEEVVSLRVRAYNTAGYSDYSNELSVKTKPVPVAVLDLSSYSPDLTWTGNTGNSWDKSSGNWSGSEANMVFTDSAKVLFGNSSVNSITLNETAGIKALVVDADSSYTVSGTGSISGTGSVNKTGTGTLALQTNNTYTGATVIYNGVLEASRLANGGLPSSIGASKNYNFNLVLKGGELAYTGPTISTDRNIKLEGDAALGVSTTGSVLTMTGIIDGSGGLEKKGTGNLLLKGLNTYEGITTVSGGLLEINGADAIGNAFSASKEYHLNGGSVKTSGGSSTVYENYYSNLVVNNGTTSSFEPYRNCYIYSKVSGSGILNFNITYVREYIQGDWSQFSGTVYANGTGTTSDGNQFMLNNTTGIPNARVVTSGNTKIVCWKNASTMYFGGLSGPAGSYLSGADKKNNSATMTWVIGGAGTDETFNGLINNECSDKNYKGTTNIVKEGTGYWKLTGANIYSGATTVKDGMLIIDGTQTGTGKVTVMNGATLAGKGTIPGSVEVQSGATLQPGDPTLGPTNFATMNVGGLVLKSGSQVNVEINRSMKLSDKVAATGAVVLAGTLNLTITGTSQVGDEFTLFTGTGISGSFSSIVPETPGDGMKWTLSNGVLKVEEDVNAVNNPNQDVIQILPNPVSKFLTISLNENYANAKIVLVNLQGRLLTSTDLLNEKQVQMNVSSLSNGIYFVKLYSNDKLKSTYKVVKK